MKASLPYKYITSVKNGKHYVVFDYKDHSGKRKRKWVNTELPEKCSKKALKEAVEAIVAEFDKSISEGEIAVKSANAVPECGSYYASLLSQGQQEIHGIHQRKLSEPHTWTGQS